MTIHRTKPNHLKKITKGFTTLPNATMEIITDPATIGVLIYLLSKTDNWEIVEKHLQNRFNKGRDFIRKRLADLRSLNLLKKRAIKNEQGQVIRWITEVYDVPFEEIQVTRNPPTGKPSSLEKPTHTKLKKEDTIKEKEQNIYIGDSDECAKPDNRKNNRYKPAKNYKDDKRFMAFYNAYPKKEKPHDAYRAFQSVIGGDDVFLHKIIAGVIERKEKHAQWKEKQYIPQPARYLRSGDYESEIVAAKTKGDDSYVKAQQRRYDDQVQQARKDEQMAQEAKMYRGIKKAVASGRSSVPKEFKDLAKKLKGESDVTE